MQDLIDFADPGQPDVYDRGDLIGGKYRLRRRAGEGGMGSVWVATNVALENDVAIKLIRRQLGGGLTNRLLVEARAAAALCHPAIVRVFDFGITSRGDPFIVMEALEGESLGALLDREGRLTPEHAVAIMLPVVNGMHAAHLQGIVHRDLKPDNIVLAVLADGRLQPKVVDFGVAKTIWVEGATTVTTILGTPGYMPPEQAMGESVDRRTDVWACCASLFHAITGAPPLEEASETGTLRAVVNADVPSLVAAAGVDPELAAIVDRGLRREPSERWPSMMDLGSALTAWLLSRGVTEDIAGGALRPSRPALSYGRPKSTTLPIPLVVRPAPEETARRPRSGRQSRLDRSRRATESGRPAAGDRASLPEEDATELAALTAPPRARRRWAAAVALLVIAAATIATGVLVTNVANPAAAHSLRGWLASTF